MAADKDSKHSEDVRDAEKMPLNAANMANLMAQFGVESVGNISFSQFTTLLNQMKQIGALQNLGLDGSNASNNQMDPLNMLQRHIKAMNQREQKNHDPTNYSSIQRQGTPNMAMNNFGYENLKTQ